MSTNNTNERYVRPEDAASFITVSNNRSTRSTKKVMDNLVPYFEVRRGSRGWKGSHLNFHLMILELFVDQT